MLFQELNLYCGYRPVDCGHVLEMANLGVDITCKCSGLSQFFGHFLILRVDVPIEPCAE